MSCVSMSVIVIRPCTESDVAAAGLLMQKDAGTPAVWIEGIDIKGNGSIRETLRDPATDLFR